MQTKGAEIGVTTRRVRRCGWLDLPVLRHSSLVNGYSAICLTKLDILDTLKEIKIAVKLVPKFVWECFETNQNLFSYKLNGKVIYNFPGSISDLAGVEVEYVTLPGWEQSTANVRDFRDLPKAAQDYVHFIQKDLDVPVKWIGVGKGRESIIKVY